MNTVDVQSKQRFVVIVLSTAVIFLAIGIIVLLLRPVNVVSNFEQCKDAGGALLETYPVQCMINGTSFTNNSQSVDDDAGSYVGLTENEALMKAGKADTPARIVEREGEGLPATMDFVFGRHNLYIKDGKVYKVEIEGLATDLEQ